MTVKEIKDAMSVGAKVGMKTAFACSIFAIKKQIETCGLTFEEVNEVVKEIESTNETRN